MAQTWIKASTAAKLRGVRRQSIYYHIKEGNIISMELDGTTYVEEGSLRNWKPKGKGEYKKRKRNDQRDSEIYTRYVEDKWTLSMCGEHFGLSDERVRQILGRMGAPSRKVSRPNALKRVAVVNAEIKDKINTELETFKKVARQIIDTLRANRPAAIQPDDETRAALERAVELVQNEQDRRVRSGRAGGRPRSNRQDSEVTRQGRSHRLRSDVESSKNPKHVET